LCASRDETLAKWIVGWVGDCRVYRVQPEGAIELLTRDDTYRQLLEPPPPGSSADDPARMVGNGAVGRPNVARIELRDDEMLALCSDGVHKHVPEREIARLIRPGPAPLARRCARLIVTARARGSTDDATVLVVHRRVNNGRRSFAWSRDALSMALAVMLVATAAIQPSLSRVVVEAAHAAGAW
jgi:serine/threonine protein phosphatase PrpC